MKIIEVIVEHSNWEIDPTVTPHDILQCKKAMLAVAGYANEHGIRLVLHKHFFDQIQLKRGFGKITPEFLMNTSGRILNRGLHLFKDKPEGTELIFHDRQTGLYIPFIKTGENSYRLPTVVRDTRWMAPGDVVDV